MGAVVKCFKTKMSKNQPQNAKMAKPNFQESVFVNSEADAWFARNEGGILEMAGKNHNVIKALMAIGLPASGELIDLGGGAGQISAGITALFAGWRATVLEPSRKAIDAGKKIYPHMTFTQGSLSQPECMPATMYELAIISGVFTWIDRALLSQAIANVDRLVKPGGYVLINDFDAPFPRANPYHHHAGLFTYKQNYALPFLALNLYTQIYYQSGPMSSHTLCDNDDPYDAWWMTAILQKDLEGRYRRPPLL